MLEIQVQYLSVGNWFKFADSKKEQQVVDYPPERRSAPMPELDKSPIIIPRPGIRPCPTSRAMIHILSRSAAGTHDQCLHRSAMVQLA